MGMNTTANKIIDVRYVLMLTFLLVYSHINGQNVCSFNTAINIDLCLNWDVNNYYSNDMNERVNDILKIVGIEKSNFIVRGCKNIQNALAYIDNSNRYILMDEEYYVNEAVNKEISFSLVLAHEIAHHLNGHTIGYKYLSNYEEQKLELECDYFSGFVLAKLGFELSEIKREARNLLYTKHYNPNSTHPSYDRRIKAIEEGYYAVKKEEEKLLRSIRATVSKEIKSSLRKEEKRKIVFLYNDAVKEYREILKGKIVSSVTIDELISKFREIDYYSDQDLNVKYFLADLYRSKNEYSLAFNYFLDGYNSTKRIEYLLYAYEVYYSSGISIAESVFNPLKEYSYKLINHPKYIKILAIYLINQGDSDKSIQALQYALENWAKYNLLESEEYLRSNLTTDLAVLFSRIENYEEAYRYINKAIKVRNFDKATSHLDFSYYDKKDYYTFMVNKALIEFRLGYSEKCINTCNRLIALLPSKYYKDKIDVYYFLGVSYYDVKEYNRAVINLSEAIKIKPEPYLYYYRGLAHESNNKPFRAVADFTIACDQKFSLACSQLEK